MPLTDPNSELMMSMPLGPPFSPSRPRSLWEHGHGSHHSAAFGAKPEGQAVLPNPHLFGTDDSGHHDSAINSNDASLYIFRAN